MAKLSEHDVDDNTDSRLDRAMGATKVGPKGQIVIPKEIRDMFDIKPGDTLVVMADIQRGIAIQRKEIIDRLFEDSFDTDASTYPGGREA